MVHVLGIDLSGATTGRTGVALVHGDERSVPEARPQRWFRGTRLPQRPQLRRLAELAVDLRVDLVAIDAPLTFPHPWTCRDDRCDQCFPEEGRDGPWGIRGSEEPAAWSGVLTQPTLPMPAAMLGSLVPRGVYLRRALEREGIPTLEAWPAAVWAQLSDDDAPMPNSISHRGPYYARAIRYLEARMRFPEDRPHGPDECDAVAAALAGWIHVTGRGCRHVGGADGICVPDAAW